MVTVAHALADAQAAGTARLDAQHLLAHCLGQTRAWLFAHDDAALSADQTAAWAAQLARLADAVPLAYLLGEHEFHGLRLAITPDVLVPRADTETLVDWALALLPGRREPRLIDLGTVLQEVLAKLPVTMECGSVQTPVRAERVKTVAARH